MTTSKMRKVIGFHKGNLGYGGGAAVLDCLHGYWYSHREGAPSIGARRKCRHCGSGPAPEFKNLTVIATATVTLEAKGFFRSEIEAKELVESELRRRYGLKDDHAITVEVKE